MRALLLASLLLTTALLAGCTDAPTRDELGFPVASRLNGVNATREGDLNLSAGPGIVIGPASNNTSIEIALAPAATTYAFHACAATCISAEAPLGSLIADAGVFSMGNASLNADGPDGDSALFFGESGSPEGRWLRWSDGADEFQLNDALTLDGNLTAFGEIGSRRVVTLRLGEPEDVLVNTAVPEGHEAIVWARGEGRLTNGSALVRMPPLFAFSTENEHVTVHVTPTSRTAGLWVSQRTNLQFRVESMDEGSSATFDWYAMAPRAGSTYHP